MNAAHRMLYNRIVIFEVPHWTALDYHAKSKMQALIRELAASKRRAPAEFAESALRHSHTTMIMLIRDVYPEQRRQMPVATSPVKHHTAVKLFFYVRDAVITRAHLSKLNMMPRISRLFGDSLLVLPVLETLTNPVAVVSALLAVIWLSSTASSINS